MEDDYISVNLFYMSSCQLYRNHKVNHARVPCYVKKAMCGLLFFLLTDNTNTTASCHHYLYWGLEEVYNLKIDNSFVLQERPLSQKKDKDESGAWVVIDVGAADNQLHMIWIECHRVEFPLCWCYTHFAVCLTSFRSLFLIVGHFRLQKVPGLFWIFLHALQYASDWVLFFFFFFKNMGQIKSRCKQ